MIRGVLLLILIMMGGCSKPAPSQYNPPNTTIEGDSVWVVWKVPRVVASSGGYTDTRPHSFGNKLVFFYDSIAHCVNKQTGSTEWIASCDAAWDSRSMVPYHAVQMPYDNNNLYVVGQSFVTCLRLSDGKQQWHFELPYEVIEPDLGLQSQSEDFLFLTTHNADEVMALSKATGQVVWRRDALEGITYEIDRLSSWPGAATYWNGIVYVGYRLYPGTDFVSYGGAVSAFDATNGRRLWTKVIPPATKDIPGGSDFWNTLTSNVADEPIHMTNEGLFLTTGHTITHLNFDGEIVWRRVLMSSDRHVAEYLGASSFLYNDQLVAYNNGPWAFLGAVHLSNGEVAWQQQTSAFGKVHTILGFPPVVDNGDVYKVTDDGWLIGQSLNGGSVTWATLLPSAITDSHVTYGFNGCFAVEGTRAYYINSHQIVCVARP